MRCAIAVLAMTLAFAATTATAGPSSQEKADALFKKGKALLGQQQYREACAAFEDSNKLDAQIGTLLNLALCYEGWGKVASAQHWYLEAEKLAAIKSDAKRGSAARQRADALSARIPKIVFAGLPETLPAELEVELDGAAVGLDALRAGISVDPGAHTVAYTVEGAKQTIRLELAESATKEVKLDLPEPTQTGNGGGTGTGTGTGTGGVEQGPPRGRGRRIAGIVMGSVGLVAVGTGIAIAFKARSDYNTAFDAHCDATGCDDVGYHQTHDARSTANLATVIVGIGGAAVVTGVILYLTAPSGRAPAKEHVWIRPELTAGGGAVVIGGTL